MGARADRQRRRILDALADKAMTSKELATLLYMNHEHMHFYMSGLKKEGRVYVESYICNRRGGRATPRWKIGNKPDAVYVKTRAAGLGDIVAIRRAQILKLLVRKMRSVNELAELMKLHPATVRRQVRDLRDLKQVRLAGWGKPTAGGYLPLYGIGNAPDEPKSYADPNQRHRDYYERHKEKLNERRKMRDKLRRNPNTWAGALGL